MPWVIFSITGLARPPTARRVGEGADPGTDFEVTADLHRWAAFCAASVEYLCER